MKTNFFSFSMKRFSVLSFLIAVGIVFSSTAFGANVTYTGNGNWEDNANWSPQAPVAADNVFISEGSEVKLSSDLSAMKFKQLNVSGKLTIESAGVLNIEPTDGTLKILNINGGVLENKGSLTIKQTKALSTVALITFGDNAATDGAFINTGILLLDNIGSTNSSGGGKAISFNQTSADRTAKLTFGGTMTFNIKSGTRFIEFTGGNAALDGTVVFGTESEPMNCRLIYFGTNANVTFQPTLNLTMWSSYVNGSGVISIANNGTCNLTNKGKITLHGKVEPATASSPGIYVSGTNAAAKCSLMNEGTITMDGNFSLGSLYINGTTSTTDCKFENSSSATLNVSNTDASAIVTSAAPIVTLTNSGTMSLSTLANQSMLFGGAISTFNNTGTVTVNKAILSNSLTDISIVNNNVGGVFDFNVLDNTAKCTDATNKILFTNSGGKVMGRGVFDATTFATSTGTLSPGGDTGIGMFTFSDPTFLLSGNCTMNVNGKSAAGTDFDQIVSTGAMTIDNASTLTMSIGGSYTPENQDLIPLFVSTALTGSFATVNAPNKWVSNYTTTNANLLFDNASAVSSAGSLNAKVYVNGNSIIINKTTDSSVLVQIISVAGKLMKEYTVKNQLNTISASDLKGIMFVRLIAEDGDLTQKIIL